MSSSDQMTMAYGEEATYGGSLLAAKLKRLRFTNHGLKQASQTTKSAEITGDRQTADLIRTSIEAQGDHGYELSYGAHDDLLEAAVCSAGWSTPVVVTASTISLESIATSASSYAKVKDSANGFGSMVANQWIRIRGAGATNNVYAKIVSAAAGELEVSHVDFTDEAASASITVTMGAQIVNGTTKRSFKIEEALTDLSNEFAVTHGASVNGVGLSVSPEAVLGGSFAWLGKNKERNTATIGDGSDTAAPSNRVMNAIDNVNAVIPGGTAASVRQFSADLTNGIRGNANIGDLGPSSRPLGEIDLTGSMQAYFASKARLQEYLADTETSLATTMTDASDNGIVIDMPRIKWDDGQATNPGRNQDIIEDLRYAALRHATEGITLRIARFPAA